MADASQTAVEALAAMSPARRAAQLFAATIANAGNTAIFGGLGAIGDIFRGTDFGTTGGQLSAQVRAASPVADTASKVLGIVGGGGVVRAVAPAVVGAGRVALTAAPTIGTRAAALGATSPSYAGTAARILGPAAGALGIAGFLNNGEAPAAAAVPVAPVVAAPTAGPVETALAAGRAAPADPQRDLAASISTILGRNPSIADVAAVGGLVPAAARPVQTQRDMVFGQAYSMSKAIADQQVAELQAQVAAGTITQDQARTAISGVLQRHFDQTAGLVGFNPANMANAAILNGSTADAN